MAKLQDGGGTGREATVSSDLRLNVSSKEAPRIFYVSRDDQRAFAAVSSFSAATGNEVFYLKNTDAERNIIIHSVVLGSVENAKFTINQATGTAAGTSASPSNLNLGSGRTADVEFFANAAVTGLTLGNVLNSSRVLANTSRALNGISQTITLGFNSAMAIEYTGTTGIVDVVVYFYFEKA